MMFAGKVRDSLEETASGGKFVRTASGFREIISEDHPVYKPAAGRYHLYISYACPWANRCLAVLRMKGLEDCIGVTVTHPVWQKTKPLDADDKHFGWAFYDSSSGVPLRNPSGLGSFAPEGCSPDPVNGAAFVRDLYELSNDTHKKFSVPVLWDTQTKSIVNNESAEIVRMFNGAAFGRWAAGPFKDHDLYPEALRDQIDAVNDWVYSGINDGVYKCGFAKSQAAYDEAVDALFAALDRAEALLGKSRYLVGNHLTEADLRLFMTLVRFDEVYVVYFKTNVRQLAEYPNLRNYCRDLFQLPAMGPCIRMEHIKQHYFASHPALNAYAVIPRGRGVAADLALPHDRDRFH